MELVVLWDIMIIWWHKFQRPDRRRYLQFCDGAQQCIRNSVVFTMAAWCITCGLDALRNATRSSLLVAMDRTKRGSQVQGRQWSITLYDTWWQFFSWYLDLPWPWMSKTIFCVGCSDALEPLKVIHGPWARFATFVDWWIPTVRIKYRSKCMCALLKSDLDESDRELLQ